MTLRDVLTEEAETTYAITRKLMARASDADLEWKPAAGATEWMSVGQLLMHCASFGCGLAVRGFATGDWGVPGGAAEVAQIPPAVALPSVRSVQEALALLQEDRRLTLAVLAAVPEDDLLARRSSAPWGGPAEPLVVHLLHMIAHLAQHKGQLFYYLKLMGKDVGTADLWGA